MLIPAPRRRAPGSAEAASAAEETNSDDALITDRTCLLHIFSRAPFTGSLRRLPPIPPQFPLLAAAAARKMRDRLRSLDCAEPACSLLSWNFCATQFLIELLKTPICCARIRIHKQRMQFQHLFPKRLRAVASSTSAPETAAAVVCPAAPWRDDCP